MRTIRDDLNEKEISEIEEALKADNFEHIKRTENSIDFQKGFRSFKLISTDLSAEDMGVRMDFDAEALIQSQTENAQESQKMLKYKHYQEKTRHTVSFNNQKDKFIDDDAAINAIPGWTIIATHNIATDDRWKAAIHTPTIYHIEINGKPHTIINDKVYEGLPDNYLAMGQMDIGQIFGETKLSEVLDRLNRLA